MTKKSCLVTALITIAVFILGTTGMIWGFKEAIKSTRENQKALKADKNHTLTFYKGNETSKNRILLIPISGVILDTQASKPPILDLLVDGAYTYGYSIKEILMDAAENEEIKTVILEINSPGGTITGAKAISDGIKYFREKTGKPVYAHISGLGASGAYWVAAASDQIHADYGSLTGSIGVILGPFKEYNKVLTESSEFGGTVQTQDGINTFFITAGEDKDFDSPYKKMSEATKTTLQEGINNEYDNFVKHVSQNRKIDEEKIKNEIGALVYENTQALNLGLIDKIASKDESIDTILENLSLDKGDYQIVTNEQPRSLLEDLLEIIKVTNLPKANLQTTCTLCNRMLFYYGIPQE